MASTSEGDKKWKKRRLSLAKAERMRAAKRARAAEASASSSPIAEFTPETSSNEPGPSGLQQEISVAHRAERDTNNLTDEGESSSSESDFDEDAAQGVFDDWVASLRSYDRKLLSVALLEAFKTRQGMLLMDAAQESASFTGFNEKTVRRYRKQFFDGFEDMKQGKYERCCLLNEEELRLDAVMWARENAYKKGEANMTAGKFCQWVNNELLPSHVLSSNLPRTISVRTANRWLHQLGFTPQSHKKGSYVDGHEREDVVKSRDEYLKLMMDLKKSHKPPPPCSDEMAPVPGPDAEFQKQLVLIYHDESLFNTNEGQSWMWATEDTPVIQPKTKGSGIMVSDFIEQHNGYLRLTDAEFAVAKTADPDMVQTA
jgi:hypothetical protein